MSLFDKFFGIKPSKPNSIPAGWEIQTIENQFFVYRDGRGYLQVERYENYYKPEYITDPEKVISDCEFYLYERAIKAINKVIEEETRQERWENKRTSTITQIRKTLNEEKS